VSIVIHSSERIAVEDYLKGELQSETKHEHLGGVVLYERLRF
jgi:hypothetical protein